jgi:tRNA (adenine22-N1)-methyltransferase
MRAISLDARLSAVAALVPRCERAADIGADHGFLGAHLLLAGRCARVCFVDISPDSLDKARRLIGKLKLSDRAEFAVGDGAQALSGRVDAAILAGLGGEAISGILRRGRGKLDDASLILSPNLDAPLLRRFLMQNGYEITDEALVCQGRRYYPVMAARPGEARYDPLELLVGPVLLRTRPENLADYARRRARIAARALAGAEAGEEPWARNYREELALWKEVLHGYGVQDAGIGG